LIAKHRNLLRTMRSRIMSRLLNRLSGRVYAWFDAKDARVPSKPLPAKYGKVSLALMDLEERAVPTLFTVTNVNDSGPGSLRQAITDANNSTVDALDTIEFNSNPLNGVDFSAGLNIILVNTVLPTFSSSTNQNVTIVGPGADKLVIARNSTTGFRGLTLAGPNDFTISGLTITNFSTSGTGGGIDFNTSNTVDSSLTLTNVSILNNSVGTNPGGGMNLGSGTFNFSNITVSGNTSNTSTGGGGIRFQGTGTGNVVNISNSTITGNKITNTSGGGAGISFASFVGTASIKNSTIVGNSTAGGTGSAGTGGGGINRTTTTAFTLAIQSSIVAGNTSANSTQISLAGTLNTLTTPNSVVGVVRLNTTDSGTNIDPRTSLIGYHRGGTTPVLVPLGSAPVSPAINAQASGSPPGGASDQTGNNRGATAPYDAGSVETNGAPFAMIPSLTNVTDPGGTSYSFDVYLYDNVGINDTTLDNDFLISGPEGFTATATYTAGSFDVLTGEASYSFTPPGTSWDGSDSGSYTITMISGAIENSSAIPFPAEFEGAFAVLLPRPTVTATSFPGLLTDPQTTYTFTVTYTDIAGGAGISFASLGNNDIRVTGAGFPVNTFATFVSSSLGAGVDGTPLTATYSITGPGGSFDSTELGQTVTFAIEPGNVTNTASTSVAGGTVGTLLVEFPQTFVVNTAADTIDADPLTTSLREAINAANANPLTKDTIEFGSLFNTAQTINLLTPLPTITASVTILNNINNAQVNIQKDSTAAAMSILNFNQAGAISTSTMTNVRLTGNSLPALVIADENLTINNSQITGVSGASSTGAGISGASGTVLTLNNTVINNNKTTGVGGGIYTDANAIVTITGSTIEGNSGITTGGGIRAGSNSTITIENSTVNGNTVGTAGSGVGGGLSAGAGSVVSVNNSTFDSNVAGSMGGGIGMTGTGTGQSLYVTNSSIIRNSSLSGTSTLGGGGIAWGGIAGHVGTGKAFLIRNSTIAGNSSPQSGGGILIQSTSTRGQFDIQNNTIVNNTASTSVSSSQGLGGGGLSISGVFTTAGSATNVALISNVITGNVAANDRNDIAFATSNQFTFSGTHNAIGDQNELASPGATIVAFDGTNLTEASSTYVNAKLTPDSVANPFGLTISSTPGKTAVLVGAQSSLFGAGFNPTAPTPALTTDQIGSVRELPTPGGIIDIGSVERAVGAPTVSLVNTLPIVTANSPGTNNPYQFSIAYSDDSAITKSSVETGLDVQVFKQSTNTLYANATFVSTTATGNDPTITALYQFTPPGDGIWDISDNGAYEVRFTGTVTGTGGSVAPAVLGTFDVALPETFTVNTTADTIDADPLTTSLREAIIAANANPATKDIINFSNLFATPQIIALETALPVITSGVIIQNNLVSNATVTLAKSASASAMSLLNFSAVGVITNSSITGLRLSGNSLPAIVIADEVLTLNNVEISGVSGASSNGAGISGGIGTNLIINNSLITNNKTSGTGGGIYTDIGASITITNSIISDNSGAATGGGIRAGASSDVIITGSTVTGNTVGTGTSGVGGGLSAGAGSVVTVDASTFDSNVAGSVGGGIAMTSTGVGQSLYILNSTVSRNTANSTTSTSGGGGVAFGGIAGHIGTGKAVLIRNSTIAGNSAVASGGGVLVQLTASGTFDIQNTTIANNAVSTNSVTEGTGGGGIAFASLSTTVPTTVSIISTIISGNTSTGTNDADDVSFDSEPLLTLNVDYNAITDQNDVTAGSGTTNAGPNSLSAVDSTYSALRLTTPSALAPAGLTLTGPGTTKTIALLSGTTALNAGFNPTSPTAALTLDQTGNARKVGARW
jgi:CSLREA domain-containing protein